MYKKILVPLDGSRRAEMIRPHVRELASRFQATVILMKVIEINFTGLGREELAGFWEADLDRFIKESKSYLAGVAAKLQISGIDCKKFVTHGPVVQRIIEVANNENADLVAMTSHGFGGLARIFYGSVAAGVLNRIDRPIFIVRSRWAE
jgi:nucleotide-binding universal stress UspA family protein